ncbi:MAG: hypothetical protein LW719_04400 [Comamonadaceae bacterium]|nr:hypothetical protein [Comamonadaceae bacterium]
MRPSVDEQLQGTCRILEEVVAPSGAQLLAQLAVAVPEPLPERIAQALARPLPDAADTTALEQHNQSLRELLAQAVCCDGLGPELHEKIKRHMIERASRVPMRYVPTAPAAVSATQATSS